MQYYWCHDQIPICQRRIIILILILLGIPSCILLLPILGLIGPHSSLWKSNPDCYYDEAILSRVSCYTDGFGIMTIIIAGSLAIICCIVGCKIPKSDAVAINIVPYGTFHPPIIV